MDLTLSDIDWIIFCPNWKNSSSTEVDYDLECFWLSKLIKRLKFHRTFDNFYDENRVPGVTSFLNFNLTVKNEAPAVVDNAWEQEFLLGADATLIKGDINLKGMQNLTISLPLVSLWLTRLPWRTLEELRKSETKNEKGSFDDQGFK